MARKTTTKSAQTNSGETDDASAKSPKKPAAAKSGDGPAELRKTELIDAVVERSGVKKKDVKPVIEAMLAVLSEALAGGRDLNLAPLGKLKINKTKDVAGGRVIVNRIRQNDEAKTPASEPLAEPAE